MEAELRAMVDRGDSVPVVQGKINEIILLFITNTRGVLNVMNNKSGLKKNRISESKGAAMMNTYSGDKADKHTFKEWSDKLVNQFAAIYQNSRELFAGIKRKINLDRKAMTDDEIRDMNPHPEITAINEDLYYILVDKTVGGDAKHQGRCSPTRIRL